MSIDTQNGSAIIAMVGKNCVAIASDLRFGVQMQTMGCSNPKMQKIHDRLYVGMAGLGTDAQTFTARLKFLTNLYRLREERDIAPRAFASLVSAEQYSRRFGPYFVSPVIAGLSTEGDPFVESFDSIGAGDGSNTFVVSGTAPEGMYGMCELLWKPDMDEDELFEAISQSLLGSLEVDAMAGWGAVVYVITPSKVTVRTLKTRMD